MFTPYWLDCFWMIAPGKTMIKKAIKSSLLSPISHYYNTYYGLDINYISVCICPFLYVYLKPGISGYIDLFFIRTYTNYLISLIWKNSLNLTFIFYLSMHNRCLINISEWISRMFYYNILYNAALFSIYYGMLNKKLTNLFIDSLFIPMF